MQPDTLIPSEPRLVVAVAASASERWALERLLSLLPGDSGVAVIAHLAPAGGTVQPELLAPCTDLEVTAAEHGARLRPNTVYVNSTGEALEVRDNRIELASSPPGCDPRDPVDQLLSSVAHELGSRSVAIVASGDAPSALREVREAGGLTIARKPEPGTERRTDPAREAIDLVLDLEDIPRTLTRFAELAAALGESEARFREMVDGLPLVVWVHGPTGEQELVNQTFCDFFGVTREEMKGGRWQMLVHPEDAADYSREFLACLKERRPFRGQVRVARADGQWRWFDSWGRPRFTSSGEYRGMVGTSADVTERKEAERKLREADRRKDEYLAMLGHELRNPVAAIRHATELIELSGAADPLVKRAHGVLERQTSHVTGLLDGLLEVSRIARGKIGLNRETVDLRDILEGALQDRAAEVAARGLVLEREMASEPVWVAGDPVRLAQIFDNLIGNAIKFTDPPGAITVIVERFEDQVVVRIRDTGAGIRPEMLERVFEPFQQADQDASRAAGGLGLGLALAHGLVELHEGTIEARSAGLGAGAELEVRLPMASAPARTRRVESPAPVPSRRILVVEDNPDAAEMLQALLETAGHRVSVVDNGRDALDRIRRRHADVVLCDIGLPGMSGYDVARAARAEPGLRDLSLIAVTGYGQPEDRRRSAAAGFDAHLTKPVDLARINAVLSRLSR